MAVWILANLADFICDYLRTISCKFY